MKPRAVPTEGALTDDGTTTRIPGAPERSGAGPRRLALSMFHSEGLHVTVLSPGVPVIIGRSAPADVRIPDRSLSRVHARFLLGRDERVLVSDLKSTNGTWSLGAPIDRCELPAGGEVLLGRVVVRVHALGPDEGPAGLGDESGLRAALEEAIGAAAGAGPTFASEAMARTLALVERAAAARVPVVLSGETGTGKEVLARFLHERSPRRARPMVSVNCAAIPAQLVESTLFGHERGAFTGATSAQKGVFEAADGGTVFLDEVAELSLAAQAALLRVLETQRLTRVGSPREVAVDVRVIAATHRDLERMAAEGLFRSDLYYRLATLVVHIPPLRERRDDIPPLCARFLAERAAGAVPPSLQSDALAALMAHDWPGNVRELRNAIERALVVAQNGRIELADLPERVREQRPVASPAQAGAVAASERGHDEPDGPEGGTPPGGAVDLRAELTAHERRLLVEMLNACDWNKTRAAARLGLPVRTLTYKMTALGILRPER